MPTLSIARILCPVDFSETSEKALRLALGLAQQFGARIALLHVVPRPIHLTTAADPLPEVGSEEALRQLAGRELDDLARRYGGHDVELTPHLAEGVADEVIVEAAADADLVVIGTHGRTGVRRLVLGSVAERVVRLSPVPVVTVR